jgi:hypothetical protein
VKTINRDSGHTVKGWFVTEFYTLHLVSDGCGKRGLSANPAKSGASMFCFARIGDLGTSSEEIMGKNPGTNHASRLPVISFFPKSADVDDSP